MYLNDFHAYCLAKKGVTEHFPFDKDTLVFKVGSKMFALSSLSEWENESPSVNLKCEPAKALILREQYEGIEAGWHMSKVHWNTIKINKDVSDKLLRELIDHSYDLVYNSLIKKEKENIETMF
jgi:predicted DNA-binding protein (MmcQ/YjbR family)